MSMTPNDNIVAKSRGTRDEALIFAGKSGAERGADVRAFLTEVYRLAPLVGLDPAILVSQSCHECDNWRSPAWVNWLNPAGLGITRKGQDPGYRWQNGTDAARAQIVHMAAYAIGPQEPTYRQAWIVLDPYRNLDPRLSAVARAGFTGTVRTIADLTGKWADDDDYHTKIVAKGNSIFPGIQDQEEPSMAIPTKHDRPTPPLYNLATDYARFGLEKWQADEIINSRFPNRNGGTPRFIVYHIQVGNSRGSLGHWSSNAVDASSTVMIQKDGSILRIIPEQHGPWTNGDVNRPLSQANAILALGGNPNQWSLTIELEGVPGEALSPAVLNALIWQSEDWIMRYPEILKNEWCLLRHGHINSVDKARCGIYNDPVIAGINAWLDGAGTVPPPEPELSEPVPPASPYPPGMGAGMAKRLYGSLTVPWASKPFTFNLNRSECRAWLARGKAQLKDGEDYTSGTWPNLIEVIRRGDGKTRTFQYSDGTAFEQVIRGI